MKAVIEPPVILENPSLTVSDRNCTWLLHTSHSHTHMSKLRNNCDTFRLEDLIDGLCHLLGESFLNL